MLEAFQRKVTACRAGSPGATGIPDYSEGEGMTDKVTFYAIIDDLSSRERPAGVSGVPTSRPEAGAMKHLPGIYIWEPSPLLVSAERGDLQNEFIEITEDEANQIVDRIRATATGANGS